MCVVSMVSDHYKDRWLEKDWIQPAPYFPPNLPNPPLSDIAKWPLNPGISRQEFDELKKEFQDFKKLVERAKQYDIDNNEPECELDEKTKIIKALAAQLGVEIDIK